MMLAPDERAVLDVFQTYMVSSGEMLCFHGPVREAHAAPLRRLIERKLLVKERFKDGYSLTDAGYAAMCEALNADC